jgi:serine/threonine protein kinase
MISGLDYLQNQGMSHRDLKLENILFDSEFNLKIADFGFASVKASNETRKGTHGYMAPEVEVGDKYNGAYADIFSIGVILFTMISQKPPITAAVLTDIYFKLLAHNQVNFFWKMHKKANKKINYSDEFKELIVSLLQFNPE